MIHYRWTSAVIGVLISVALLYLVRRDQLHPRYSPWWLLTACAIIIFGTMPQLIDLIGKKLGVHYPPILLIVVAICLMLLKMLMMDIDRSKRERQVRRLAQRLAILEGDLQNCRQQHSPVEGKEKPSLFDESS